MNHSAHLDRTMRRDRYVKTIPSAPESALLSLQPLQTLVYADNRQMTMFRNSLFMDRVATDPLQLGEKNPNVITWDMLNSNVY